MMCPTAPPSTGVPRTAMMVNVSANWSNTIAAKNIHHEAPKVVLTDIMPPLSSPTMFIQLFTMMKPVNPQLHRDNEQQRERGEVRRNASNRNER